MQVCPVAANMPAKAPLQALLRSASAKMILGDLPPSSMMTGVNVLLAAAEMARPAPALPVKLILSRPLALASAAPVRASPVTTLKTPAGKPACSISLLNSSVVTEACSDGLTTTQLPAARQAASLLPSSDVGAVERDDLAPELVGIAGVEAQHPREVARLAAGLPDDLAVVGGFQIADALRRSIDQLGQPEHQRGALAPGLVLPDLLEGVARRLNCHRHFVGVGLCDLGPGLLRERIVGCKALLVARWHPAAPDVQVVGG